MSQLHMPGITSYAGWENGRLKEFTIIFSSFYLLRSSEISLRQWHIFGLATVSHCRLWRYRENGCNAVYSVILKVYIKFLYNYVWLILLLSYSKLVAKCFCLVISITVWIWLVSTIADLPWLVSKITVKFWLVNTIAV